MKNRDHVMHAIEELRALPLGAQRRERVESLIEQTNADSTAAFHRNRWVWLATIMLITPLLLLLGKNSGVGALNPPIWVAYLILIAGLFGVAWIWTRLPQRMGLHVLRIHQTCHQCGYDLTAHESMLGDDVWVGPPQCPECGQTYPAIG